MQQKIEQYRTRARLVSEAAKVKKETPKEISSPVVTRNENESPKDSISSMNMQEAKSKYIESFPCYCIVKF